MMLYLCCIFDFVSNKNGSLTHDVFTIRSYLTFSKTKWLHKAKLQEELTKITDIV